MNERRQTSVRRLHWVDDGNQIKASKQAAQDEKRRSTQATNIIITIDFSLADPQPHSTSAGPNHRHGQTTPRINKDKGMVWGRTIPRIIGQVRS